MESKKRKRGISHHFCFFFLLLFSLVVVVFYSDPLKSFFPIFISGQCLSMVCFFLFPLIAHLLFIFFLSCD